jgi:hypothetical protein
MSEKIAKETAAVYTVPATRLAIPPEWSWLTALNLEERTKFFQEIIDILAATQRSNEWSTLAELITAWKEKATTREEQALTQLKQQVIAAGGSPEIAALLGKYRGQLSSVDEFIHNKQLEKSLEQ